MPSATTTLGTPRAESWDNPWLNFVAETELRLGRRICGAHAPDGEPCELASTHPNGRCRFHGGHPRIGAQPGNTNALIHGLYSRRLRQCNNTCPVWHMCPFAGPDVSALSDRKRPICAYEREAYAIATGMTDMEWAAPTYAAMTGASAAGQAPHGANTASADPAGVHEIFGRGSSGQSARDDLVDQLRVRSRPFFGSSSATTKFPRDPEAPLAAPAEEAPTPSAQALPDYDSAAGIVDDTAAILYAMLQRATLTLSAHSLTESTEAQGERYSFRTTKMSAALSAFLRIGRELRAWMRLRPALTSKAAENAPGFGGDAARPKKNEQGYTQFYDYLGNPIGLPTLMHPFLHELDAAVAQLRAEGIKVPPPEKKP